MFLCDMCGYMGELDKNDPKYLMMFDLKMKDQVPEQYVNSLRELRFCSKCRKLLLGFINTKRAENDLSPITNGLLSFPSDKENLNSDNSLLEYCRNDQDLLKSIKAHEKEN